MAYQTPLTIRKTLQRIGSKDYVLPAIQREFVWAREPERICRLFDSILRGYPIGTFLFWDVTPEYSTKFHFYEFMRDWHEKTNRHNARLPIDDPRSLVAILDGQQRLTALNVGVHGSLTPRAKGKRTSAVDAYPPRHLYVDLLYEATEDDDLCYGFEFLTSAQATSPTEDEHWYRVKDILSLEDSDVSIFDYVQAHDLGDSQAFKVLSRLWKGINEDGVISYFEEDEQDLNRVLDIFVRVNSGGVVLTKSDLLLSIATAQFTERDAREEIHGLVDDLNEVRFGFNFTKDLVLKTGLVLTDISDIGFAVDNFTAANMALLDKRWDEVDQALRIGVRLLASFGFSASTLPAGSVLIPIADYIHQRGLDESYLKSAQPAVAADRATIRHWVIRSILRPGIWGSALDQLLRALHQIVRDTTGPFPVEQIETEMAKRGKSLTFDDALIDDLVDSPYKHKRTFALLTLLYDWVDTRNEFHVDHVFPRGLFTAGKLKAQGIPSGDVDEYRDRVENLGNLQLLGGPENVQKRAMLPADWAAQQYPDPVARQAWLAGNDLAGLPADLEEFVPFFENRRSTLRARLTALLAVGGTAGPLSAPVAAATPKPPRSSPVTYASRSSEARTRRWHNVSLRDLVDAELVPAGTTLTGRRGQETFHVTVAGDGQLERDGELFASPSMAARAVLEAAAVNGWVFWLMPDGRSLAAVRSELEDEV